MEHSMDLDLDQDLSLGQEQEDLVTKDLYWYQGLGKTMTKELGLSIGTVILLGTSLVVGVLIWRRWRS